ncbi:MAG: tRNA (adenine-N1)-methyltransferase [Methanobrevibacter sp.]|nr:tRNA (adenine-N1)-methyltransferase [Candidatus Methanoflexus mossambicus]
MIIDERGKKYIVNNEDFHSDLGIVKKEDIINSKVGDTLITHLDKKFKVMKPNVNDYIDLMKRNCSILVLKDIGTVISHTGIGEGSKVLDSGTGAGAIALHFSNVVGKSGEVISYEIREDFAKIAKENIDNFFNGNNNVTIKNQDIKEGFDEKDLDLIFLDLPKPYEIMENCYDSLNLGGWLVIYAPYINTVETSYKIAKKLDFNNVSIIETLQREIEVRTQGTRPKTRMVGHTGYLLFARKL